MLRKFEVLLLTHVLTISYALYSSLSPGFQLYLEGLSALHSAVAQAEGARSAGLPVRRHEIETIHPVVRVHPTTGWKSIYVNPG
jgi:sulfonate dioxygenase